MFCQKCGVEINEGTNFCPKCGNVISGNLSSEGVNDKNTVEIKNFSQCAQSKIPLELLEGEKLILQCNVSIISGLAANGVLSLTNKRILIKKDSFGKASLKTAGLLSGALSSSVKVVPEIKLSDVSSVKAAKVRGDKNGVELTTRDGYTHRYIFPRRKMWSKERINTRDSFISLVQSALS